jgi:iron complex outermembrane receptor protein
MVLQQTSTKTRFQDKGFNHLLSLNSVIYLKNSKLDVDLGYVANDRSEFVDSDGRFAYETQNFNYDAKYYLPKMGTLESIVGIQGMHQTNTNLGEI